MAAREGQGIQIAVIVFAMLTILLAITTYIFFAQSQTASKDAEAKARQLAEEQTVNRKLLFREAAAKYALGLPEATLQDVEQAKANAGGDDPIASQILSMFNEDAALVGDQLGPDQAKSYRSIVGALVQALARKNAALSDASEQIRRLQMEKDTVVAQEKARVEEALATAAKAASDLQTEQANYAALRAKNEEDKGRLSAQVSEISEKLKAESDRLRQLEDKFVKDEKRYKDTIQSLQDRLRECEQEKGTLSLFESPDGRIKLVNQRQRQVWIDVGRADGLLRQTTFAVYDHNENGIASAKRKGRIEVVSVGDRLSEARILEDDPANPIIPGDLIATPAWSPGQRIHFALALKMDINKDGIDDFDLVKNVILMNGGVIDAELRANGKRTGNMTVNTRYYIEGEKPDEGASEELLKQLAEFEAERVRLGVERKSVSELLTLMGWKAEERAVELSGAHRGGVIGGPTPPAEKRPEAEPAAPAARPSGTPAAPAEVSPF
jgi:hypothetical protein